MQKTGNIYFATLVTVATTIAVAMTTTVAAQEAYTSAKAGRFTLGGYGEAVGQRMGYSDDVARYSYPESHADETHGRFDLPHAGLYMGYEFGHGWRLSTEIEFEHGGAGSAYEIENEEAGEYEHETEKGGEVALEQFWIEKTFAPEANLRAGHIIVPIGLTNAHHLPTEFFTVLRPEEESSVLPCTWHQTGVSFWGNAGALRYEALFTSGLDAERFNNAGWISGGSVSPYEFEIANAYAGAARLDYTWKHLRLGVSGYFGQSALNSLKWSRDKTKDIKGQVGIGDLDAVYNDGRFIARTNILYGHLGDSYQLSLVNRSLPAAGPGARTHVASDVLSYYLEAGYDVLSLFPSAAGHGRLYLFAHYGYYDTMYKVDSHLQKKKWSEKHIYSAGLNYYPIPQVVVKAEYTYRQLAKQYNDEPTFSLGVAYSGLFIK
jgi:opacity protein-like surface antigen